MRHPRPRAARLLRGSLLLALAVEAVALTGCAGPRLLTPIPGGREVGEASYYGAEFQGRRTASGDVYRKDELTAAHRTLPFGTRLRVTNLDNGRSTIVRVTDRGPSRRGRVIDLSERAAREIGMIRAGIARVRLEVLD